MRAAATDLETASAPILRPPLASGNGRQLRPPQCETTALPGGPPAGRLEDRARHESRCPLKTAATSISGRSRHSFRLILARTPRPVPVTPLLSPRSTLSGLTAGSTRHQARSPDSQIHKHGSDSSQLTEQSIHSVLPQDLPENRKRLGARQTVQCGFRRRCGGYPADRGFNIPQVRLLVESHFLLQLPSVKAFRRRARKTYIISPDNDLDRPRLDCGTYRHAEGHIGIQRRRPECPVNSHHHGGAFTAIMNHVYRQYHVSQQAGAAAHVQVYSAQCLVREIHRGRDQADTPTRIPHEFHRQVP